MSALLLLMAVGQAPFWNGDVGKQIDINSLIIQPVYTSTWHLDTVIYAGIDSCEHDFVTGGIPNTKGFCSVLHDERGCPNTWGRRSKICRKCLRKEIWREERHRAAKVKTEHEILEEKVDSLLRSKK